MLSYALPAYTRGMATFTGEDAQRLKKSGKSWEQVGSLMGLSADAARGRARRWRAKNKRMADWPTVIGLGPEDGLPDPEVVLEKARRAQEQNNILGQRRQDQSIMLPGNLPTGIAFISDLHYGGAGVDYAAADRDATIVAETEGLYASFHGDGYDNWIIGRLVGLQRYQVLTFDEEFALFESFIRRTRPLWLISGNHENWTHQLAGYDRIRECLKGTRVLYDRHEIAFTLHLAKAMWKIKVRHKWRGTSVFNDTHGIEVGWQRGTSEFDIGVGGHTHRATLIRPFIRHHEKKYAVLTGTYKTEDEYGRQLGLAESHGSGCGAIIFFPDGRMFACEDLQTAAEFLAFARKERMGCN